MAEFRIDQASPGAGTPGESRHDLVSGEVISLVATSPTGAGVSYAWEILDKDGSTAVLSSSSGSSVTIGPAGSINQPCAFLIQLTVNDNGTVTRVKRIASVRTANAALRLPLFGETAPTSHTIAANDPDDSTDNATYADRAGLGVAGKNWRGWNEWARELVLASEASAGGGPPTGSAGGDLAGSYPNPTVDGLQGVGISAASPSNGDVLTYNSGTGVWEPAAAGGGSASDLQDAYDGGPAVTLVAGTPIALTAGALNDNVITFSDPNHSSSIRAGQVQGANNDSLSLPYYSWAGHADTGMYLSAAGEIGFTTEGARAMRLKSTLDAASSLEQALFLEATVDKAADNYSLIYGNVTETSAPGESNTLLALHVGGVGRFVVDSTGEIIVGTRPHAARHLSGEPEEIDGDRLDIDYSPSNYTPSTAPTEVTLSAELTAHLAGIDNALGSTASLQDAYDGGAEITLAANTPIEITTSGANQDGITVTDGSNTIEIEGAALRLPNGEAGSPSLSIGSGTNYGIYRTGNNVAFAANGSLQWYYTSGQVVLHNADLVGVGAGSIDLGSTAIPFGETFTQRISNYTNDGGLLIRADMRNGTTTPLFQFVNLDTFSANSGQQGFMDLSADVNQSGTAGYYGIRLNMQESGVGTGQRLLLDLQTSGTPVFGVEPSGDIRINSGSAIKVNSRDTITLIDSPLATMFATSPSFMDMNLDTSGISGTAEWRGIRMEITDDVIGAFMDLRFNGTRYGSIEWLGTGPGVIFRGGDGSDTQPTFGFQSDLDLGFYYGGTGIMEMVGALRPNVDGNSSLGDAAKKLGNVHSNDVTVYDELLFGPSGRIASGFLTQTTASTSIALTSADAGKLFYCTAATAITVTVPDSLPARFHCAFIQGGTGQITLVQGGSMTLHHPTMFTPSTAEQWSPLTLQVYAADNALVSGHLANTGFVLTTETPATPGTTEALAGNNTAGSTTLEFVDPAPPGEPATVDEPYFLQLTSTTPALTENVVVIGRSGTSRTLAAPLQNDFSAGDADVAYAGLATAPTEAGLMTAEAHHRLEGIETGATRNVPSDTVGGAGIQAVGDANSAGVESEYARADHVHARPSPKAVRTEAGANATIDSADHDRILRLTSTGEVGVTFNTGTEGQYGTIIQTGVGGETTLNSGTATVQVETGRVTTSTPVGTGGVTLNYYYLTSTLVHVTGNLAFDLNPSD